MPDLANLLSPEALEILKQLPPADLEVIMGMLAGKPAEMPAAAPSIELEIEAGGGEGEAPEEGEGEGVAKEVAAADAPPAMAALTREDVQQMLSAAMADMCGKVKDMIGAMKGDAPAAAPAAPVPAVPAEEAKVDSIDDVKATIAFLRGVERMNPTSAHLDSLDAAITAATKLVESYAPNLVPFAETAAKARKLDALFALAKEADDRRRDKLVGSQLDALRMTCDGDGDVFSGMAPKYFDLSARGAK